VNDTHGRLSKTWPRLGRVHSASAIRFDQDQRAAGDQGRYGAASGPPFSNSPDFGL
jgi:hypothetical protein